MSILTTSEPLPLSIDQSAYLAGAVSRPQASLVLSLWIPGNWSPIPFPFQMDYMQLTFAPKASTLQITDYLIQSNVGSV